MIDYEHLAKFSIFIERKMLFMCDIRFIIPSRICGDIAFCHVFSYTKQFQITRTDGWVNA